MNPQEPVVPDPSPPPSQPNAPVDDPDRPEAPAQYDVKGQAGAADTDEDEGLDDYDKAVADSFPASDPPSQSEPGSS